MAEPITTGTAVSDGTAIDSQHPWPWLDAYTADAAAFFNGRDDDTARLLGCVLAAPAAVFFGKSGLGKTSLVQAGLGPRLLDKRLLPVMVRMRGIEALSLSRTLLDALTAAVQAAGLRWEGHTVPADDPRSPTAQLWERLHESEGAFRSAAGARWTPVFVLDQFEEVFTLIAEPEHRRAIFNELGDLIEGRVPPEVALRLQADEALSDRIDPDRIGARFLLSLREDFLPDLETWADHIPRLGPNRCRLLPMTPAQALDAITRTGGPLVQAEDARRIVDFLGSQGETADSARRPQAAARSVEPALLSLVCAGLNQDRLTQQPPGDRLDTQDLATRGGRLLEAFYDDGIASLPAERREHAKALIERELITAGGTRRPFPRRDVAKSGLSEADLAVLTDKRLLRIENTEQGDYIELVHDRVAEVAGVRAAQAGERAEQAAREAERAEQEARKRQQRKVYAWAFSSVLAVTVAGLVAVSYQWRIAVTAQKEAVTQAKSAASAALAAEAALALAEESKAAEIRAAASVATASALVKDANASAAAADAIAKKESKNAQAASAEAIEANRKGIIAQNEAEETARKLAVRNLVEKGQKLLKVSRQGDDYVKGALSLLAAHRLALGLEPAEKTLSYDALRSEFDRQTSPLWVRNHGAVVESVSFSKESGEVVSIGKNGSVRQWNEAGIENQTPVLVANAGAAVFKPNEPYVVVVDAKKKRFLRSGSTASLVDGEMQDAEKISTVMINSDRTHLLSFSEDKKVRIWDVKSGAEWLQLSGDKIETAPSCFAISPKGDYIATGHTKNGMRLWTRKDGLLKGQTQSVSGDGSDPVRSIAFSPSRDQIVVGRASGRLVAWNIFPLKSVGEPLVSGPTLTSVAFSPDGNRIVSGSKEGKVRMWITPIEGFSAQLLRDPNIMNKWAETLCAKLPRNLTEQEWKESALNVTYVPQCPGK